MTEPQQPTDDGDNSIESWGDEPVCTFNPETGFAINQRSVNTLRWYSYLSNQREDGEVS